MSELITLFVNNQRFRFWENINLTLSLDSIDNFTFTTPLQPDNLEVTENFKPVTYTSLAVKMNNESIIVGNLISKSLALSAKTINFGGYSKPGILSDLTIPFDKYPLEFKKQDLRQIATEMAFCYNIEVDFKSPPGPVFTPAVSPEPGEKILDFIIKLAKKRELLVSNTQTGKLSFFVPGTSKTVTPLRQGKIPLLNAKVDYKEQQVYSSVTGLGAAKFGRSPEAFTVKIPVLSSINRPFVYTVSENEGADLEKAVKFKAGRLFGEAFAITADVDSWRGIDKKIWKPGDFVELQADDVFFYRPTKLMIKNITLNQTANSESAALDLIFPGVYSGEFPEKLPWD